MNKQAFLAGLEKELKEKNVADLGDIIAEYEQHFAYKLADGYSEEEIAAKLGSPEEIAAQYAESASPGAPGAQGGRRAVLKTGLVFSGLFAGMLWLVLALAVFAVGVFSAACAAVGLALILKINVASLLPEMPYFGALLFGLSCLFLAVLSFAGTLVCALYLSAWTRRYLSWQKSLLSGESRPLSAGQIHFTGKRRRLLRNAAVFSLIGFVLTSVVGMAAMFAYTDWQPFWHALGWFGYEGWAEL